MERVIGIGASAGGLEALTEFLGALQVGTGAAFVIAQHLAPSHPSLIVDLLAKATGLRIVEAVDGATLEPDVVFIAPPNRDIEVTGEHLRVREPIARVVPSPSVDLLFESMAQYWGALCVGVVLSGTGSDGAHGLRTIRGVNGYAMVQSIQSARFDGMPRAAISVGGADVVGEPGELACLLAGLAPDTGDSLGQPQPDLSTAVFATVTSHLKRTVGIDFSQYKESTIRRQIQRRMAVRQTSDVDAYVFMLLHDPREAQALSGTLLVTVTSFFRDPEAFDALRGRLARYLAQMEAEQVIRVWVPGCATGEEVYSLAMLIGAILDFPADLSRRLKVFGTDLDESSLTVARRATYPASVAEQIPEVMRRAFTKNVLDGFQVSDVIRECTVFARHDVCTDPPFPRIDLVSCRNTMIYFTSPLQKRVISTFGFALRPGALLFLGKAENLDRSARGFGTLDAQWRIFERTTEQVPPSSQPTNVTVRQASTAVRSAVRGRPAGDIAREHYVAMLEALLRASGRACLVVDDDHNLLQVVGDVAPYCQLPEGRITTAAESFLRPELQGEARALLLLCRADRMPVTGHDIHVGSLGLKVQLQASPLRVDDTDCTILTFLPASEPGASSRPLPARNEIFDREIQRLERELLAGQDTLRRSLAELEAVNQELEASAEELQASSEELQSSNEELQASNEELQATNEELGRLNQNLRERSDDLQQINSDLENIQASLSQGMVIVDQKLRVTRFTPLAVRVFGLMDADRGQPLLSVPTTMPIRGLEVSLTAVMEGESRRSIHATDGATSYLVQILPYCAEDGRRLGAIVTLTDVTEVLDPRALAQPVAVSGLGEGLDSRGRPDGHGPGH